MSEAITYPVSKQKNMPLAAAFETFLNSKGCYKNDKPFLVNVADDGSMMITNLNSDSEFCLGRLVELIARHPV